MRRILARDIQGSPGACKRKGSITFCAERREMAQFWTDHKVKDSKGKS